MFDFETTDLRCAEAFLSRAYTRVRLECPGKPAPTRAQRRWLGALSFSDLDIHTELHYELDPLNKVCITRAHAGFIETHTTGDATTFLTAKDSICISSGELPSSGRMYATFDVTMFDTAELSKVAATDPVSSDATVRLTGRQLVSRAAGRRLSSLIDYLRGVLIDAEARESELVAATAISHLAATVLAAFPNNAVAEPNCADRIDAAKSTRLRRAMAFVEENAQLDITVNDIAAALYVSPRSVQYMFRRHMDCTPMDYLRRVRLHRAHQDLQDSDPTTSSVGQIAHRWGFAHVGRFASHYRAQYGQEPHRTLRG
ncbi:MULTISPECIES: helix-turn-helix transcriptional regulator [Mycobacterium]|uniref:HTH araC/xylS-type domain-containing protein n=1 Tax=Mycobacterium kiyosense TaxID=2871094 RepID=A0A9P3Q4C1_9MYCO|nr:MULTISPECIES: helix-turn-helix transcriptional regulator [Mycobacterium]BDE12601.1 hypothetical protein MKCMC460_14610 [Mycobacterium sp. 20KCMC460]GLB84897.1 hypothetical protein SRL2020028_41530 [Mycobacterium kiyosense]GLB87952.1 hypothetical protein SRL2020130_07690 [Mycobacterium kiyosense]GLB98076.1 hypothetical protein SRL2020226_48520 [Mycobacterium kiyosense]GLC04278.1 hypothetical protein SRL2020400_48690 [Mycobacterium kiyosense]